MPITNDQQYQEAQSVFAAGTAKDMPRLRAAILEYENRSGISDEQPQEQAPKAGPQGFWKPERPLSTMDYVPQDIGGNLTVWRETPVSKYIDEVAAPQRAMAIAAGEKAALDFQRYGVNAFATETQVQMTMAIAQGAAAAAQDLSSIDEGDPGYKQFNEQQWQQAVQRHSQNPSAGPIQRHEQIREVAQRARRLSDPKAGPGFAAQTAYHLGNLTELGKAAGQGVLSALSLGVTREKPESLMEAGAFADQALTGAIPEALGVKRLPTPKLDESWHYRAEENPLAHGLGSALGSFVPGSGTGTLAKEVFGAGATALAPKAARLAAAEGPQALNALQRYGAGALSGGATFATEEGVGDVVSGETEGLAGRTALRFGLGSGAGLLGQGVADVTGAAARKLSERTIRGPAGRSVYQQAEAAGYDFDPILGIREPQGVTQARTRAAESGEPWAQDFANRAERRIAENVDQYAAAEAADMARENLSYFQSVGGEGLTPMTNLNRQYVQEFSKLRKVSPKLASNLQSIVEGIDPYMDPEGMGNALEMLSNRLNQAEAGSDTLTAKALANLQRELMKDMQALPRGTLPEGWPALRAQHDARGAEIKETRDLLELPSEGLRSPKELAGLNNLLKKQGQFGMPVRAERQLDRFMPPDLRQEAFMLRGANALQEMGGPSTGVPYPSRAGVLAGVGRFVAPRAYALSKGASLSVPDNYPVSDKMFTWVQARMPRATMFVPGMDLPRAIQQLNEMQNRPKKWGDLTPEQQQLLLGAVGTPEQQEVLQ